MSRKRLREEWNATPDNGMLPDEIKSRMWKRIRKATLNRYRYTYYISAACALLFASVIAYQYFTQPELNNAQAIVTKTFPDDIRLIRLPDSTRVWINQNTEIEYPSEFSGDERVVYLKGEAFFEVKRDTLRPFIITSGAIKTTVLGTSFNVRAYQGHAAEVAVRTGKVKVESDKSTVFLERGHAGIYMQADNLLIKTAARVLEPEWKKALIDVDGLTLEEVIAQLKKDRHFEIDYSDEELKHLRIKGSLDTRHGVAEMLETIAFALNVNVHANGKDAYRISR